MNKIMIICILAVILFITSERNSLSGTGNLVQDASSNVIMAFVPDPAKSQVNSSMTGKVKFAKDGTGNVNIKNWLAIRVRPTADCTYYYNNDATKTFPLDGGVAEIIFVMHPGVASVTIQFGNATASVQGM